MGFAYKRGMAKFLKFDEGNYGKMENGKDPITKPLIEILEDKFPKYNINWILYNELPKQNAENNSNAVKEEEQPIQQINKLTSNLKQQMSLENHNYLVELMKEKLDRISQQLSECQEELSTYKEVKPNAKHASSK